MVVNAHTLTGIILNPMINTITANTSSPIITPGASQNTLAADLAILIIGVQTPTSASPIFLPMASTITNRALST